VRGLLDRLGLHCVVETGARFLLDPRRKHWPTLLSVADHDWQRRLHFLYRAVDVAAILGADAVSFWSGATDRPQTDIVSAGQLAANCTMLSGYAADRNVRLALEPEPGMFVATMAGLDELESLCGSPANLGLTLDVGHVHCLGDGSVVEHIHRWRDRLWNVHIEDMRRGVHEHLMFGEGEMAFPPILRALKEIDYPGGVHVELSRHSHDAVATARKALAFLREALTMA
jgi:sugar phosphate isomerase/epimerase